MGLNVLLVDDSSVMRKLVSRSLRQSGVDISGTAEAGDGAQGLEALGAQPIDVVLCDWNMPVMDGLEFVTEARKAYTMPIVMLTTESAGDKVAAAMAAGADAYITKPFTPERLRECIDGVFAARKAA